MKHSQHNPLVSERRCVKLDFVWDKVKHNRSKCDGNLQPTCHWCQSEIACCHKYQIWPAQAHHHPKNQPPQPNCCWESTHSNLCNPQFKSVFEGPNLCFIVLQLPDTNGRPFIIMTEYPKHAIHLKQKNWSAHLPEWLSCGVKYRYHAAWWVPMQATTRQDGGETYVL